MYEHDYYDEKHFQNYAWDRKLGTSPTVHASNTISTAYETAPSKDGIFLRDFFRKKYRGLNRLVE